MMGRVPECTVVVPGPSQSPEAIVERSAPDVLEWLTHAVACADLVACPRCTWVITGRVVLPSGFERPLPTLKPGRDIVEF